MTTSIYHPSPVGILEITADNTVLERVQITADNRSPQPDTSANALILAAIQQLDEYFAGLRTIFTIPLATAATPFQRRLRLELAQIPYGTTISYSQLARNCDRPNAARAIASALAANPLHIVIPCHRVIHADGTLSGYAAGTAAKRYLLELERKNAR